MGCDQRMTLRTSLLTISHSFIKKVLFSQLMHNEASFLLSLRVSGMKCREHDSLFIGFATERDANLFFAYTGLHDI